MKIAHGNSAYSVSKMTFQIKLAEKNWYHIPRYLSDISGQSSDFQPGDPVTRQEFLSVLMSIKHILLRSTFHTDQIESLLEAAVMEFAEEEPGYGSVEKCSCPSGMCYYFNLLLLVVIDLDFFDYIIAIVHLIGHVRAR